MQWIGILLALAATACASSGGQPQVARVELTGTVVERSLAPGAGGTWRQLAILETTDGRRVRVDLGPPGGEATIAEGERVRVTGRAEQRAGAPVLVDPVVVRLPGSAASGGR